MMEKKQNIVDDIFQILNSNSVIIFVNYKGLNAKSMTSFRKTLKAKGANLKIFKDTLVKRAFNTSKFDIDGISHFIKDQIAISYSNDPITLCNVLNNFVDNNNAVKIVFGLLDGEVIDIAKIESLSALVSAENVKSKFIGLIQALNSKFIGLLNSYENKLKA